MQIIHAITISLVHSCCNTSVTTALVHLLFHQWEKRSCRAPQFQPWPSKSP